MAEEWFQSELTALIKDVVPHIMWMQSAEFTGLMDLVMKIVNLSRGMQMHCFCYCYTILRYDGFMQKCWHLGWNCINLIYALISINFRYWSLIMEAGPPLPYNLNLTHTNCGPLTKASHFTEVQ